MALKTPVVDRVSTYPGRITLRTPGATSGGTTYDLVRADSPTTEGTPINAALFNQKAYTLTESVTVYVSTAGSDVTGDGTSAAPYKTIQKAINELPKCLGGYHAQIDIAAGTYNERVTIDGFYGGRLTLGVSDRTVTVNGVSVMSSDGVRLNISNITYNSANAGTLLYADYGSNVTVLEPLSIRGGSAAVSGVAAARGSTINASATMAIMGCGSAAVLATSGSKIGFNTINGGTPANTSWGLRAELGGIITYSEKGLTATTGDGAFSGGRILTSSGSDLVSATV